MFVSAREVFEMTSEADKLAAMRAWLGLRLTPLALSAAETGALVVAVGELCTNAVTHAYQGRPGGSIKVTCEVDGDRLVIEVEDFGTGFDLPAAGGLDPNTLPEHGLGIYLARRAVDSLTTEPSRPRGTRWTLVKRLGSRSPA